jgi:AAA family ATP:ADP antiporter
MRNLLGLSRRVLLAKQEITVLASLSTLTRRQGERAARFELDRPARHQIACSPMAPPEPIAEPPSSSAPGRDGLLARLLRVFAVVHSNEIFSVMMLTLDGILLLASYYFLKVKSYATAFLAILLIFVFYGYRALAQRVPRLKLIAYTKYACAACLVVFSALGHAGVAIGVPFFLWVGCYSLTILAQLWAFANDIYTPEQGKRLFVIIALGSSVGALIGSYLAGLAVKRIGLYNMMLVPAVTLMVCLAIIRAVNARAIKDIVQKKRDETPPGGAGGLSMIVRHRYLLLIGLIILLLNLVNTNGEYILDRTLEVVKEQRGYDAAAARIWLGEFKADYFFWANLVGVVLQLFVASRVLKYLDVRGTLFIYPVLALCSYGAMTAAATLTVVEFGKISENALDYSVYNTVKQALWLPTTREEKYVGKQAVDTFVVRAGDLVSGFVVAFGAWVGMETKHFTLLNVALAAIWILVAYATGKENRRRTAEMEARRASEPVNV